MRGDPYNLMLRYRELAHAAKPPEGWSAPLAFDEWPDRQTLHALWASGLFDRFGDERSGRFVRVYDPGVWNRGPGADFEGAHVEIGGIRQVGSIAVTCRAEDELPKEGGDIALHVAACPPSGIRSAEGAPGHEPPLLILPAERLRLALDLPPRRRGALGEAVARPMEKASFQVIDALLRAGAAYRMRRKRRRFLIEKETVGAGQAWFQAWAKTLGYSANKGAMNLLAARVPLEKARENPEALLFGTAGFLVPVLPGRSTEEARAYHADVWRTWWNLRDRFELLGERAIPWSFSGVRPQNHPHRRVAALAATAARWSEMEPLLSAERFEIFFQWLSTLRHPYWSFHVSLPSAGRAETALVGKERALDFAVNHILPNDGGEKAWNIFVRLRAGTPAKAVAETALALWGERPDLSSFMRMAYAQQGLLQLRDDFGVAGPGEELLFPEALRRWGGAD